MSVDIENNGTVQNADINVIVLNAESGLDFAQQLLEEWGFNHLIDDFKQKGIDFECLKCMTIEDINNLIPAENLGMRIKFRTRLFEWRRINGFATPLAETVSNSTNITNWLLENSLDNSSPTPTKLDNSNSDRPLTSSIPKSLDLERLLEDSFLGKSVKEHFAKKKSLSHTSRNDLCSVIANFWIAKKRQVTNIDYKEAVQEIKKVFPKEKEETYLSTSQKAKGKLAARYYTLSRKYQQKGVLRSRYNLKVHQSTPTKSGNNSSVDDSTSASILEDSKWLKKNFEPDQLVLQAWVRTHSYRMSHVKNESIDILKEWPILKQNFASNLIEVDFEQIYPGRDKLLSSKWDKYIGRILNIFKESIKDNYSKKILEKINQDTSTETIDFISIYLLPAILLPTIIHKGTQKWKPSILEAQQTLILQVEVENNIITKAQQHKKLLIDKGLCVQPFIIAVGEITSFNNFYVYFNDTLYKFRTFCKALSVAFKIFNVFNLEYPKPVNQIWEFIQYYFYEIPLSGKKTNALYGLLSDLQE